MSQLQASQVRLEPEDWVDAYGDDLFRYARARLHDSGAAEEVVQDTFLAGIRFHADYSGQGSQKGWLLAILKRKIIDYVRRRAKQGHAEEDADVTATLFDENGQWKSGVLPAVPPDEHIETGELWQVVRACLAHLPQGQADVFMLSVMEEMDSQEICRVLDISPSNLWVRLHRARLSLAKCVGSKWFLDDKGADSHV